MARVITKERHVAGNVKVKVKIKYPTVLHRDLTVCNTA